MHSWSLMTSLETFGHTVILRRKHQTDKSLLGWIFLSSAQKLWISHAEYKMTLTIRQLVKLRHEILAYQSRTLCCHKGSELFPLAVSVFLNSSLNSPVILGCLTDDSVPVRVSRRDVGRRFWPVFIRQEFVSYVATQQATQPCLQGITARANKFWRKCNTGRFKFSVNIYCKNIETECISKMFTDNVLFSTKISGLSFFYS